MYAAVPLVILDYCMTTVHADLPIIISGDTIGFLDPQEKVWPQGGWSYELGDMWKRNNLLNTMLPFIEKQGFTSNMKMYPGTLFRFPLRNDISDISEKPYTVENLCDLLMNFKEEAKFLLLFLQSVTTIEIIDKTNTFSIQIAEEKQIHDKDAFIQNVHKAWEQLQGASKPMSLVIKLNVTIHVNESLKSEHSWLIAYYLGCLVGDDLCKAKKLNVMPYVGVAMEVPIDGAAASELLVDNAREIHLDDTVAATSRIFCFLPMPVELTCPLPVHINGTFATSDDRRSLKWRSAQNQSEEDEARWNEIIVSRLLPHCYALLIKEACQRLIHSDVVYRMWPNVTDVLKSKHWNPVLEPLLKILYTQNNFWTTDGSIGRWVGLKDAIITPIVESCPPGWEIVCDVIAKSNKMLVEVPQNVLECLKLKHHVTVSELTPFLVTQLLKQYPSSYINRPQDEKLALLMFCLSDKCFTNVVGLQLLALANGKYAEFHAASINAEQKFLCTDRYPLEVFLERSHHQLVNIIEADKRTLFLELAESGKTNLCLLDDKTTSALMSKYVSDISYSQWLPLFWDWSQSHELKYFLGQYLIPLSCPHNYVAQLSDSKVSKIVYLQDDGDEEILKCLQKFSILYVKCSDYPYFKHADLANYIHKFSPNGILNALQNISLPETMAMDLTEAYIFQQFLSSIAPPSSSQIEVLLSLPIFITTMDTITSIGKASSSSWKRNVVMMTSEQFDIACLPSNLVVLKSINNRPLLEKFAKKFIKFPDINDMIQTVLLLMVKEDAIVSSDQTDKMMYYILQFLSSNGIDMCKEISTLPFIKVEENPLSRRKCPIELYSPTLSKLFFGKPVIPLPPYDNSMCLNYLMRCGLITLISPQMIIDVINEIGTKPSDSNCNGTKVSSVQMVRAHAVLKYLLSCSREELNTMVSFQHKQMTLQIAVVQSFSTHDWLPVQYVPRIDYPKDLNWKGSDYPSHFTSKANGILVINTKTHHIAGSQVLIVDTREYLNAPERVPELGLSSLPSVEHVLDHFTHVRDRSTKLSTEVLHDIVCQIYEFLSKHSSEPLDIAKIKAYKCPWIMVQDGHFAFPEMVAMKGRKDCSLINLAPYNHFCVPSTLLKYNDLFTKCGVEKETTDKQLLMVLSTMKMKADYTLQSMNIVVIILNSLTDSGTKMVNLQDSNLYVPVESKSYYFELQDASMVVYSESDDLTGYGIGLEDNIVESEDTLDASEPCLLLHHDVNLKLAAFLNLRSLKYHSPFGAEPFGQSENITNRIRTILRDYPFDITVMKELIQNADDAKASKVYFIVDMRTHGNKNLLSPEWEELQGPALLVWNDRQFSDDDLKGIQNIGLGSKGSRVESIGQYGIGFNVVYHLTDCPSFITTGRLYVLDPFGRYVKSKDPTRPGCSFRVTKNFLRHHLSLRSAYLYSDVNISENVHSGTLFRFPLKQSYITDSMNNSQFLTADYLYSMLQIWIKQDIKLVLLFLNHVREIKLCFIDNKDSFHVFYHCVCRFQQSMEQKFSQLYSEVQNFTMHAKPYQLQYQINLVEFDGKTEPMSSDLWMIQQGVGDRDSNIESWQLIKSKKPHYGIAVPFNPSVTPSASGQIFCFLPLPIKSKLPVHINGRFCLDSSRRALWTSSVPGQSDERQRWNLNLGKAVSSSYAALLSSIAPEYVGTSHSDEKELDNRLKNFFCLFPNWKIYSPATNPEGMWLQVAKDVYKSLVKQNACILCQKVEVAGKSEIQVQWHPIKGRDEIDQIYLPCANSNLTKLLVRMGLKFTCIPLSLKSFFLEVEEELPKINPNIAFKSFDVLCKAKSNVAYPCPVECTVFKSTDDFVLFTKYVLQTQGNGFLKFPTTPFSLPLILTADNYLHPLTKSMQVIKSSNSSLFPNSKQCFMHPHLVTLNYSSEYFLPPNAMRISYLEDILDHNLPHALKHKQYTDQASQFFKYPYLHDLWKCLSSDPYFHAHRGFVNRNWALLLTWNNELYLRDDVGLLPVILEYNNSIKHESDVKIEQSRLLYKKMVLVLLELGMPFLNDDIVITDISECPHISDYMKILNNMIYLHRRSDISSTLTEEHIDIILEYFCTHSSLMPNIEKLTELPLLKNAAGSDLNVAGSALQGKKLYLLIDLICIPEIISCMRIETSCVFVSKSWKWADFLKQICPKTKILSPEEFYAQFVIPNLEKFTEGERYVILKHIRDTIYFHYRGNYKLMEKAEYQLIKKALSEAQCIGPECRLISNYCDHRNPIFSLFSGLFNFLPEYFKDGEESVWLEFFSQYNLKMSISNKEFIDLCKMVAREVNAEASHYLLEHLSSNCTWYEDFEFISSISEIPFVCASSVSTVRWICEPPKHNGVMTKLCGTAVEEHTSLLWTLQPIVTLPLPLCQRRSLFQMVKTPSASDVISNIINISSKSTNSGQGLFLNFPDELKTPKECLTLLDVMVHNFKYLKQHMEVTESCQFNCLADLPCIPVYANPSLKSKDKMVLVKPLQVVLTGDGYNFHPHVHTLPDELSEVFPFLQVIGVRKQIELHHLRLILESQLNSSCNEPIVSNAVELLYRLLQQETNKMYNAQLLSPLYLPNAQGQLRDSTKLLLLDYQCRDINFSDPSLLFKLPQKCVFSEVNLCELLPTSLAPKAMSTCCKEIVSSIPTDQCSVVLNNYKASLISENFRIALCLIVQDITACDQISNEIYDWLVTFQNAVKVIGVEKLTITVYYNDHDVATMASVLHMDSTSYKIYIKSNLNGVYIDFAYRKFANQLIQLLLMNISSTNWNTKQLIDAIPLLLKCNGWNETNECLQEIHIKSVRTQVDIKLGAEVPESCIDYDVCSPLKTWVVYENEKGDMVFVQIVNWDVSCNAINTERYKILLNETETTFAGRLQLYNIKTESLTQNEHSVVKIKEDISKLLEYFSSTYDREKLLQRLYFTWLYQNQSVLDFLKDKIVQLFPENEASNTPTLPQLAHPYGKPSDVEMDTCHHPVPSSHYDVQGSSTNATIQHHLPVDVQSPKINQGNTLRSRSVVKKYLPHVTSGRALLDKWNSIAQGLFKDRWKGRCVCADITNYPDQKEGKRWLEQAKNDYKALQLLNYSLNRQGYQDMCCHVCFMAHQVAEKALKGGRYALCGMSNDLLASHNLTPHAHAIQKAKPELFNRLVELSVPLEQYYLGTRFPNRHQHPLVPKDVYRASDASEAFENAGNILKIIEKLIDG